MYAIHYRVKVYGCTRGVNPAAPLRKASHSADRAR